ncbi:ATP-binding protein [Streptomyces sp. NPDC096079]|uniref:ATP-binding protein n=1 Tax=Streptomyces sp. NPDC096079 TaxID=3155820 RepID=UPI003319D2CA
MQKLRRTLRARLNHWGQPDLVDDAELLLTELVTNAFRHAGAPTVDVRVYRQGAFIQIEVNDGSPCGRVPRLASPYDEHGRGLFLVDALAHAWGVSDDRTTTWCTLPLPQGHPELNLSPAAPAPVRHETALRLPADVSALTLAGIKGRTTLTLLNWSGNQHAAVSVLYVLVRNALQHGFTPGPQQTLTIRLGVTEARELLIDVEDPNPAFPDFDQAVAGERGLGLPAARHLGAALSWSPNRPGEPVGKTVHAVMQPGEADL